MSGALPDVRCSEDRPPFHQPLGRREQVGPREATHRPILDDVGGTRMAGTVPCHVQPPPRVAGRLALVGQDFRRLRSAAGLRQNRLVSLDAPGPDGPEFRGLAPQDRRGQVGPGTPEAIGYVVLTGFGAI